jgi:hypothetical protein
MRLDRLEGPYPPSRRLAGETDSGLQPASAPRRRSAEQLHQARHSPRRLSPAALFFATEWSDGEGSGQATSVQAPPAVPGAGAPDAERAGQRRDGQTIPSGGWQA